nr:tetratricopeptide repeat protein [Acidobacteriota bacterium]
MNKNNRKILLLLSFLMAICISVTYGQTSVPKNTNAQRLELNQPLERQIKGGEVQVFQFNLKAGFYARAEVEQKNIDVVVSLFSPDGKLVVEMDGEDGRLWREAVSAIAEKKGEYRVEIKAYGAAGKSGTYTVKLIENRQSVPSDSKRLKAETHLSAGRKFFGQSKFQEAAKEYEAAIQLWRELNDVKWEAVSLVNLGGTYSNLSKNESAISAHTQATELFQKTKDRIGESKLYCSPLRQTEFRESILTKMEDTSRWEKAGIGLLKKRQKSFF